MSTSDMDAEASRRSATAPYSSHNPVPNIGRYEKQQQRRDAQTLPAAAEPVEDEDPGKLQSLVNRAKSHLGSHHSDEGSQSNAKHSSPYPSENQNQRSTSDDEQNRSKPHEHSNDGPDDSGAQRHDDDGNPAGKGGDGPDKSSGKQGEKGGIDGIIDGLVDPKAKRKQLHHAKRDHREREVMDPVTHLPVTIHDVSEKELEHVPENMPPSNSSPQAFHEEANDTAAQTSATGSSNRTVPSVKKLFPPPQFENARAELVRIFQFTISIGLGLVLAGVMLVLVATRIFDISLRSLGRNQDEEPKALPGLGLMVSTGVLATMVAGLGGLIIWVLRGWLERKVDEIWQNEVWEAERESGQDKSDDDIPESTHWLNSILSSLWPLVNPDLFTSLADELEDVMQASLPKLVKMISVEDLGQGSESIRILGVRWLPTGAAASSVSADGSVKSDPSSDSKGDGAANDRKVQGEGEMEDDSKDDKKPSEPAPDEKGLANDSEGDNQNVAEGMEAEEGDFVNMEIAIAYRARAAGRSLRTKSKNAHLFLAFYLSGGVKFPVWVELRGMVATLRLRLQLTPDPPFFALCTLTLLGQPKVDMSCVPLSKKGLNIMDLPLVSSFVQSSVDAAMAEYVAPKSLTLDIKDMIVGDDFKKDTNARGILVVRIKKALDFKRADGGTAGLLKGSSDPYVTVGWAKFGKPVWSTRVITEEMKPVWDETAFVTIGPDEVNAEERLRVQLWDSDRMTADDDLGRVEVDLKTLMKDAPTHGKMCDRADSLRGINDGEQMPGTLEWSVGYFSKIGILPGQLKAQTVDTSIRDIQQLKRKVSETADRKLREASDRDESQEVDQQKAQDLHSTTTQMIASAPPSDEYVSGILSITIHQISGLELTKLNKTSGKDDEGDDQGEEQEGDDVPSSYCHVILNHAKIFRTRTKPKNAQPFFNAGTEKFIRDWRNTELIVSVRDARNRENDPILGIVLLNLGHVFKDRSQVNDHYPLFGGVGYGRVRISLMFRSVQLRLPAELLGWDWGTLQVTSKIISHDLPHEYSHLRLKLRTTIAKGKMISTEDGWKGKHDGPVHLAVRKRYRSCIVIEFRKNSIGPDKTPAFAVIWMKDIPEEEERVVTATVWKSDSNLKHAETCCETDLGEKLGHIEVPLKFWPGLSGYHKKLASKDDNVRDVIEVLDCAHEDRAAKGGSGGDHSETESTDSDDEGEKPPASSAGGPSIKSKENSQTDEHRGPIDQIKDYAAHKDELHRRHRGLMQWKTPRTMQWMKTKLHHSGNHLADRFNYKEREPGIETEA